MELFNGKITDFKINEKMPSVEIVISNKDQKITFKCPLKSRRIDFSNKAVVNQKINSLITRILHSVIPELSGKIDYARAKENLLNEQATCIIDDGEPMIVYLSNEKYSFNKYYFYDIPIPSDESDIQDSSIDLHESIMKKLSEPEKLNFVVKGFIPYKEDEKEMDR